MFSLKLVSSSSRIDLGSDKIKPFSDVSEVMFFFSMICFL